MPSIKADNTRDPSGSSTWCSSSFVSLSWGAPFPGPLAEGSLPAAPLLEGLRGGPPLVGLLGCEEARSYCLPVVEPAGMSPEAKPKFAFTLERHWPQDKTVEPAEGWWLIAQEKDATGTDYDIWK